MIISHSVHLRTRIFKQKL